MKKFLILVAAVVMTAGAASAQNWAIGGRVGSGFQAVGQYTLGSGNYVEGRFGAYWANHGGGVTADFSALYFWNIANMNWTPSAGQWFFDAGAGLNVGGREHYAYVGAQGVAKLGIEFSGAPVRLSFDWSPSFGPGIVYLPKETIGDVTFGGSHAAFNEMALVNFGITCTYSF